jgi:hypothetical protein
MSRTYLGKPHPKKTHLPPALRKASLSQRLLPYLMLGTVLLGGGTLWATGETTSVDGSVALQKSVAKAAGSGPYANPCPSFNARKIFPLIPSNLLADPSKEKTSEDKCSPPYWNLAIVIIMSYKILGLLNWIATTLAIMLTVYAGLLYLTAFASDDRAKTAKKIVIAAYVGLIIVFSARLLLYGAVQLVTNETDPKEALDNANPT